MTEDVPGVARRPAGEVETVLANRSWWDAAAAGYQEEHGAFLGDADFVWGPEGLREADARLLGDVAGRRALEIGAGAAQCARWLTGQGAHAVASDLSGAQLGAARELDELHGTALPLVQADAGRMPFADASFDLVVSAYGALPFVADSAGVVREAARVLRPGGRFAFSVTHPVRWAFPDDPGPAGLTATGSYFDRRPYVEQDEQGRATYVEHHRTLGDRVRDVAAAGLVLVDLVEPEWPAGHDRTWGGWSPLRGRLLPGTAVFVCDKPR
ncbi:methyltransferase family protein [Motilibacter rhizosphaerae]|uniref:Methyltransferase family protein n=1 Tax=Motilibacter rhizosphaerae TaxID=598652 RepID=A0A4Q7NGA7_9ACTN|nr:class I SAM-dependent methyltransferase [Motilibacter rhizosphaerae]RZS82852.1 methyltransferase family protein [Motilibacter rhizosphaerae]